MRLALLALAVTLALPAASQTSLPPTAPVTIDGPLSLAAHSLSDTAINPHFVKAVKPMGSRYLVNDWTFN